MDSDTGNKSEKINLSAYLKSKFDFYEVIVLQSEDNEYLIHLTYDGDDWRVVKVSYGEPLGNIVDRLKSALMGAEKWFRRYVITQHSTALSLLIRAYDMADNGYYVLGNEIFRITPGNALPQKIVSLDGVTQFGISLDGNTFTKLTIFTADYITIIRRNGFECIPKSSNRTRVVKEDLHR